MGSLLLLADSTSGALSVGMIIYICRRIQPAAY